MKRQPPLVVLILGGTAERWGCPEDESPLALAPTPHLDRLAREGRVLGVRLLEEGQSPDGVAPLLAILGLDPGHHETARASYLGALLRQRIAAEECFASADFLALFRDLVADAEPGLRPAESEVLLRDAAARVKRAGFRLFAGAGARHLAVAPRASVDALVRAPVALLGRSMGDFAPRVEQHAFAHRLAREALEGHEINEVRRDLGGNGADALWIWGPGGAAHIEHEWDVPVAALGTELVWRGVCHAAKIPVRAPNAKAPGQLVRALNQELKKGGLVFAYARRGVRDALLRERTLRTAGLADLDRHLVGPFAEAVAAARGRLLVLAETARETASGAPLADPVPALIWGAGVEGLFERPFTEAGAAAAGEPVAPGHGLLAYVRHL